MVSAINLGCRLVKKKQTLSSNSFGVLGCIPLGVCLSDRRVRVLGSELHIDGFSSNREGSLLHAVACALARDGVSFRLFVYYSESYEREGARCTSGDCIYAHS